MEQTDSRKTRLIHIRLTEEEHKRLKFLCVDQDISMQDLVSQLVAERVTRGRMLARSKQKRSEAKSA